MQMILNGFDLLCKGGYVMVPLLVCSSVSVAVLVERYIRIRAAGRDTSQLARRVEDELYNRNFRAAEAALASEDSPVARVLAAGLRDCHLGERSIERAMEEQGTREVHLLTKRLGWLDTIITIAPLLGLLGTVTGMISAFNVIASREGISTPTAITGGVAEALIATATGLAIAITTLVGYNYLQERIKNIVAEIETRASSLLNVLVEIGGDTGETKRLSA